ncbi:MAG: UDP-3-O-(3-hydroxymyristoyl)glucosamine N-acyltransferase [Bacteroidia bacterium]|nr:UDP-3-O-(3-hydroxymyristoyl)glucosamine N-acyltransferase [Bacteroidia bacterium]
MKLTLSQIAQITGGIVEGSDSIEVCQLAKIEEAQTGSLTFLHNPKYIPFLYTTQASAILINRDFVLERSVETALIRVPNAYAAFTQLLQLTSEDLTENLSGIEQPCYIDPTAQIGLNCYIGAFSYIGPNVVIGSNTQIYPHTYLGRGVQIGNNTRIHSNTTIYQNCHIGSHCIIHSGVVIGSDGFGFVPSANGSFQKIPQIGIVLIEDNVEIGANTCIDRATLGETRIRSGVKIDNLVQIAHNVDVGENTVIAAQSGISGSTKLGKNCMIGGQVGIVGHLNIADGTQVGAQSGISKSIKNTGKAMRGSPAQDIKLQLKIEALIRNLPDLFEKVSRLEKLVQLQELEKNQ